MRQKHDEKDDEQDDRHGGGQRRDDDHLFLSFRGPFRLAARALRAALLDGAAVAGFRRSCRGVAFRVGARHAAGASGCRRLRDDRRRSFHGIYEGHGRILAELLHVVQHIRRGGVTLLQIGVHGAHGDVLQAERHARGKLARAARAAVDVLNGDGNGRFTVVGGAAGQHFVHHDAEGIQVGAVVHAGALRLFRRDIMDGAEGFAGQRVLRRADARDAEISDLDAAVLEDHDIVRLDVTVHDAAAVRVFQRLGDLHGKMQGLAPVEVPLLLQILLEGNALDQLHDDIIRVFRMGDVVHADDVRVRQHGDRLRFRVESAAELLITRKLIFQYLHGNGAVQPVIQRAVYDRHTAGADDFQDLVAIVEQSSDIILHSSSLLKSG